MKHGFIFLCACLSALFAKAQTDTAFAYADYSLFYIDDTTQRHFPRKEETRLYLEKNRSVYVNHGVLVALQRKINDPQEAAYHAEYRFDQVRGGYFKDFNTGVLSYIAPAPAAATYLIEEPIPEMKWEVLQDARKIGDYNCQKAVCAFRGRKWEAWFCADLPYSNGPWKFGGLPGLILEARDESGDIIFSFRGFGKGSDIGPLAIPAKLAKITYQQYDRLTDAMNKDAQAMIGAARASGGTVLMGSSSSSQSGPPRRIKILNNPLEKTRP